MSEFTKNSNYKDNAGIKQVKFGFERPILEVELNEMQQVLDSRMREYIKQTSGNCVLGEGTMTYTGGTFKIQNEVAIIDGILVKITSLSLAVSNGEKIYLKIKEKEVAFGDTLKKEGNEQETVNIANYIMDERYNIESTRRIIVSYNLSKTTGETESKYLELGEIVGGQFKVNDNIGSKVAYVAGWEEGEYDDEIQYFYGNEFLATDDDFSGTTNGSFRYIGTATTVKIPPVIKGVPVTSYASMFNTDNGRLVEKVISLNPNVTNMSFMFEYSQATTLDLSSFNTSNVTNMSFMFARTRATTLDLSSFNISNVTDMSFMFYNSQATTGYARTQADADKLNASSNKPVGLTFVVKP